ncbi:mechanosensitive ion channel protein MscS [Rhodanobacter sp. Root480]|jgi:small-conductance mechanosensitive channel|uniref:mechanosensitive ion channel family protein n=1 Tax=unclassified Rhodanobacter TaxID=2621553 RepID=UPI0006FA2025|nr:MULTISPECIES: mechanosensitive ion channel domain-containing protein [unclassified Rhodanobacter]KQX96421.1 mechanosensitive ion channel protein MscS [Rhodanobacter sp. Root480]KRA31718.1 mechanosensitive ion channel protein MscS [Rhodanobacter sp. Root627]
MLLAAALIPAEPAATPVSEWLSRPLFHGGGFDLTVGSLAAAVLLFCLCVLLSMLVRQLLRRYARRYEHVNLSSIYVFGRLMHYLLLLVGVLLALNASGIPIARFTVFAGALGVGLGFGLQAIFNNFVCGVVLLFDRSLKVGDFVDLASGVHGRVRDIHIRATRITTNDDIDILVPNSEFVNGRVVNWTVREGFRRLKVPFHVAYASDKETVRQAALQAVHEVKFTLDAEGDKAPQVRLVAFGEWALQFELVVWLNADATRRPGAALAAYNWALHDALLAHGITIPLPQRDVQLRRPQRAIPVS